jgi:hypothetical protein
VDRFLVHDAWGHQWQAALLRFEDAFQEIATFGALPELEHEARDASGESLGFGRALERLADSLRAGSEAERVETAELDRFLLAEGTRRLVRASSGLVAEMLADVVEYKYLLQRPEHAERLDSSSFFPELAAKLDLSSADLVLYHRLALAGFESFAHAAEEREAFALRLARAHPRWPASLAAEVTEILRSRIEAWLAWAFSPEPRFEFTGETLHANLASRMLLQLLALSTQLNAVLARLPRATSTRSGTLRGVIDWLVLSAAAFYDRDPERNFWRLDEYVGLGFERCSRRVAHALEAMQPPPED